jgi:hypothetical protein
MSAIIQNMFPDADPDFVKAVLGNNPSLEDVRSLADSMAAGKYPKSNNYTEEDDISRATANSMTNSAASMSPDSTTGKKKRGGLRSKLGKAFGGLRGNSGNTGNDSMGGSTPPAPAIPPVPTGGPSSGPSSQSGASVTPPPVPSGPTIPDIVGPSFDTGTNHQGGAGTTAFGPNSQQVRQQDHTKPVSPSGDANSQANLERMLQQQVQQSAQVHGNTIQSPETLLTPIPAEFERNDDGEIVDAQSLRPFTEYRQGVSTQGIRLFTSLRDPSSAQFMVDHVDCIESFGAVLTQLAKVCEVPVNSIAIFHDPIGNTIAFNRGKALYYNLRFFYALHYHNGTRPPTADCYSYWYVTTAHELAHHLVSAHNKEHAFYTESYSALYLPRLAKLLSTLPE